MKRMLSNGDVLYIQSLDRLRRNKQMILDERQELIKGKIGEDIQNMNTYLRKITIISGLIA